MVRFNTLWNTWLYEVYYYIGSLTLYKSVAGTFYMAFQLFGILIVYLQWGLGVCSPRGTRPLTRTRGWLSVCHIVLPSLCSEGVRFLAFFCQTASSTGNIFPQRLRGQSSGRDSGCWLSFFFPLSCPSPQEGCTRDIRMLYSISQQSA